MFDVAVLGSVNLDLVATTSRLPAPGETVLGERVSEYAGGKGLNQAVAAARAGAGVALIAAVGDDDAGARLRALAADEGIDVRLVVTIPGRPTGRAVITVDAAGQNCIVVVPGANHAVTGAESADVHSPAATVMLAQLEIPIPAVVRAFTAARAAGSSTILNPAPAAPLPDELLAVTDIIVPNEHELERLGGAEALLARGVDVVIVTRGADGVTVHQRATTWHHPAIPVTAVDTTGAGDAFCGVLAARLAARAPLRDAVAWGAAAGAGAATVAGAVASLPSITRIRALLDSAR